MKESSSRPIQVTPELAASCDGPDQTGNFDRAFRAILKVSHPVILERERKYRESRNGTGKKKARRR